MRVPLVALAWLASLGSLAHAGVATTTTTAPIESTTSTTVAPATTTSTVGPTTTTVEPTTTTLPPTTSTVPVSTTSTSVATSTSTSTSVSSSTSLTSSSTSTSVSTTTSSSTSTSLPSTTTTSTLPGAELCGNCADDDGDGLTDLEDPECCDQGPGALTVQRLRLVPADAETSLALDGSGLPPLTTLAPPTQTLFVQLAADDAPPLLCASVHAVHFRGKRDRATFSDRTGGVPSAGGISKIVLQRLGTGALQVDLRGKRLAFATPAASQLRVVMALRSLVTPGTPVRCVAGTVDVVAAKNGGLELR